MIISPSFFNIDLLAIGITIAAICILAFVVFLGNRHSATGRAFIFLAALTVLYSATNYVSYQVNEPTTILWLLRITVFFAVWHAFSFFHFAYVFPSTSLSYPSIYKKVLLPFIVLVSGLTLSPLVFAGLQQTGGGGMVPQAVLGPAILVFAVSTFGLVFAALFLLVRKTAHAQKIERVQLLFVLAGATVTFLLIIVFNLFLPLVFQIVRYIPIVAIAFFPFIALTTYAIMKHHLLSIKVISTEVLAFLLAIGTFLDIVFSQSLSQTLFRTGEFVLVLIFSLLLIQSVQREVEQREELERLDKELENKNKQLEDLSRFKSQLLSLASHQIRSPLAAMKGFLMLIEDGSYGPIDAKIKDTLSKVRAQADELIALINTLLDVRKVEEGKMEYQFAKTDLTKIVNDVVEILKSLAENKKLEFAFASPGKEIWVNADAEKLKQVVQNLVDNAIKYTPSGFVRVGLKEENGAAVVSVADSGLGIAPTLVPYLFEEFVRDERVKKEIRGTGLGLYIARKIAEAHGGKIWAESEGEGKGSTFHVSIPEVK